MTQLQSSAPATAPTTDDLEFEDAWTTYINRWPNPADHSDDRAVFRSGYFAGKNPPAAGGAVNGHSNAFTWHARLRESRYGDSHTPQTPLEAAWAAYVHVRPLAYMNTGSRNFLRARNVFASGWERA